MYINTFFKRFILLLCVISLYSCDKDFNTIGSDLVDNSHFDFVKFTGNVVAYNQKFDAVQSNNLSVNALGIYDDATFGTTTANFATQLTLSIENPTLGNNPVIDSVILYIPYFIDATKTVNKTDGSHEYTLDNIYGDANGKLKLNVFRSGRYLRNLDLTLNPQAYYTDQNSVFFDEKVGTRLNNNAALSQNDEFFFSNKEFKFTTTTNGVETSTYLAPGMRLNLDKEYFKTNIIDAIASGKLVTNDVFKDYFSGLYFQVEKSGSNPTNMTMLNFNAGTIRIVYKEDSSADATVKLDKSITLNLTGNTVSLLANSNVKTDYSNATNSPNVTQGDSRLYVKGGEGSLATLNLFGTGELESLKGQNLLINEANLVFHVDKTLMKTENYPQRLYLYDMNNNRPLVDYYDTSTGTNAKNGKVIYGGLLSTDTDGTISYKFRITNHIINLVNKDSTNVKLGLVTTENINTITSVNLKVSTANFGKVPTSSVMSPLGIVLFGNNIPFGDPNYDKRIKLEIYYTKPN